MNNWTMCIGFILAAMIAGMGCGGTDATETASKCAESDLISQCPLGSNPILDAQATSSCEGSGDANLITESGSVTGVCQGTGSCTVLCQFQTPCDCGVESISQDKITCNPCDGLTSCTPGAERCNGADREICNQDGKLWETAACSDGTSCQGNPDGTTVCDSTCNVGEGNCDGDLSDGCEPLNTETNCGSCGERCSIANGNGTCTSGMCEVASCDGGFSDLNNNPSDGCEAMCEPGAQRCDGDSFETCSSQGQWELTEECGDGELGLTVLIPTCMENHPLGIGCYACDANNPSALNICDSQNRDTVYECQSNGLYRERNCGFGTLNDNLCYEDPDHALGGGCWECRVSERECENDDLYTCESGTFERTTCANGCSYGNGANPYADCR